MKRKHEEIIGCAILALVLLASVGLAALLRYVEFWLFWRAGS